MKRCNTCKKYKFLTEFHKQKASKDGLHPQCKACHRERYARTRERHLQKCREYMDTEKGKAARARRSYKAQLTPAKENCRRVTRAAIKSGELVRQPCEFCDKPAHLSEAHHEDYTKPLEVRWVCRQCHVREFHNGITEEEQARAVSNADL